MAISPDGAVCMPAGCSLLRIAADHVTSYPVGFPSITISFNSAGTALVGGATSVVRGNPQALPTRGNRCDQRLPRLSVHPPRSILELRRHPTVTFTVDEPSFVAGSITFA
jgi:hypothetical protein